MLDELRFQLARPSYDAWLATATLVESDGQGQPVFRVLEDADPLDDDGFLSLLIRIYEQDVFRTLRVGDDLRVYVHLDLPPREIEKMLHFREDGQFEGEGMAEPTRDLHTLIASMFEYYRPRVQSGDVFTISFQAQRN
jgi:hypothetical protein